MKNSIRNEAVVGLVHHMLYGRCVVDPEYHEATLAKFVTRPDIETFDCCLPYGEARQERLIEAIRGCGKQDIVYATHLFPLRKLSFAATTYAEQVQVRQLVSPMIAHAAAMGASGFIFASGGPPAREGSDLQRQAFEDFCVWLCDQLGEHGITALLEPFDFDFDKRFLFGPLDECLGLVERVTGRGGKIGIELDVAHLPLMREPMVSAIERCGEWIKRVHLGNCVMQDKADPFYGDLHPPIGYVGGEIDVPELVDILGALKRIGFIGADRRGSLVIELNPFPTMNEDQSVADNFRRVEEAWSVVCGSPSGSLLAAASTL